MTFFPCKKLSWYRRHLRPHLELFCMQVIEVHGPDLRHRIPRYDIQCSTSPLEKLKLDNMRPSIQSSCPLPMVTTTVQSYHQALADLIQDQERRRKLSISHLVAAVDTKSEQRAKPIPSPDQNMPTRQKPTKTFQLYIAHLQPKRKPGLRIQLLRRLHKRRKRAESDALKISRVRPSRIWSMT